MPIHKFSYHVLHPCIQHSVSSEPFCICPLTDLKVSCLIYIKGESGNFNVGFYTLENDEVVSPISLIKNVLRVKFFLCNEGFDSHDLLNKRISKGRAVRFFRDPKHTALYEEIVVLCSWVRVGTQRKPVVWFQITSAYRLWSVMVMFPCKWINPYMLKEFTRLSVHATSADMFTGMNRTDQVCKNSYMG